MGNFLKNNSDFEKTLLSHDRYVPRFSNLYNIYFYSLDSDSESEVTPFSEYSKYHAKKVSFGDEEISMERNQITKNFQLLEDPYKRSNILTITYDESDSWSVKTFHENWIKKFYNRHKDYYMSTETGENPKSRFFDISVYFPSYINANKEYHIRFFKCIPCNIGDLNFEWNSSPSMLGTSIKYYITGWAWEDDDPESIVYNDSNRKLAVNTEIGYTGTTTQTDRIIDRGMTTVEKNGIITEASISYGLTNGEIYTETMDYGWGARAGYSRSDTQQVIQDTSTAIQKSINLRDIYNNMKSSSGEIQVDYAYALLELASSTGFNGVMVKEAQEIIQKHN